MPNEFTPCLKLLASCNFRNVDPKIFFSSFELVLRSFAKSRKSAPYNAGGSGPMQVRPRDPGSCHVNLTTHMLP